MTASPDMPPPSRLLVAIDGIDGSGKTILADRLVQVLAADGVRTVMFHVDDFRRPVDWARTDRQEVDLYYDEYYDLGALDGCLRAFNRGDAAIEAALFDQASGRVGPVRTVDLTGAVAIVEGIFVRRLPEVLKSAVVVAIETSPAEARRRLLVRDTAKGRSQAEIAHRISARYFPAQDRYRAVLGHASAPAVVIDNERPTAARLLSVDSTRVPPTLERAIRRLLGWPSHR